MSNLIRGISENGGVVFCGVDSTEIVRTAEKLHTTSATCSAALGRLLTGVSLMGAMLKDDGDSITLRVSGGAPRASSSPAPTHTATSRAASTTRWWSFPQRRTAIWTWAAQSAKTAF